MNCTVCGHANPERVKFCLECGTPVAARCGSCGCELSSAAKFCGECGAALVATAAKRPSHPDAAIGIGLATPVAPQQAPEGERKTVTALFADIKGSMELIEGLDPEEARAIVDPALTLMMDAVHRYDGYVVQSTGDGIFALFGAPVAHEDHPQRALYAALRMQDEMKRYAELLRAEQGLTLLVRVGVNTGEVVVRSLQTGAAQTEYVPIGHSTSLAARLQALANPGAVVMSDTVRRLVEGYFQFTPLGPVRIKGVSDPVNVYEVTGLGPVRTRLQRAAQRGLSKFVGREAEMQQLRRALDLAKAGHGQITAVVGESGMGKSRLFYEFKAIARDGAALVEAVSVSHDKASSYLPLIELLNDYFEIGAADDARRRREKVAGRVLTLDRVLEDTLPYLFALLGILEGEDPLAQMDTHVRRRRTHEAIKRLVLRESLNQSMVLVFEDLHWVDDETQALLNLLADSIANARVLLLVNYRPEYRHDWGGRTYYMQLRLDPLGIDSAGVMLSALLGDNTDLEPLKRLIIEKTQGNPFFMEETVQVLLDQGALVRDESRAETPAPRVRLTRRLDELRIPSSVQGMLTSRIDRLPPDEKDLLQTLAVIGRAFAVTLLKQVVTKPPEELDRILSDLQLAEFIYEQPAFPDSEYVFKHALTQEVAYNSILTARRRILHERIAEAMEVLFVDNLDRHFAEVAYHYSRSGNIDKAVEYLGRAAEQDFRLSAHKEGVVRLASALEMLGTLPESSDRDRRELELRVALGPLLMATRGWSAPEVESTYTRALELCKRVDDSPRLFLTLRGLWEYYEARGELEKAEDLSLRLFGLAECSNDTGLLLVAHDVFADTAFWTGDLLRASEHSERGFALHDDRLHRSLAFSYGGYDPAVACLCFASLALWMRGYPDQALEKNRSALALALQLAQPFSQAFTLYFAATLHYLRREATAARHATRSAIQLCDEGGFPFYLALCTALHGWAIAALGEGDEGIRQIRSGLADYVGTGADLERPLCLILLADASHRFGQAEESAEAVTQALAAALEMGHRTYESELYRLRGELLRAQNLSADSGAEASFRRAIEAARRQTARSWELRAATSLARLQRDQGYRDEARALLAPIYNWFTEGFDTHDLVEAKALLEDL